jgi:hypothetical protein
MKTKLLLLSTILFSVFSFAQINVTESFETEFPTGWTTSGTVYPPGRQYEPNYSCLGQYSIGASSTTTNNWVMIVTSSYISNGGQIAINFQYRPKYSYSANEYIYYETNNSGTWNLIGAATQTTSSSCNLVSRTLVSGTIPAGTSVKFRMQLNWLVGPTNGAVYFDNVIISQTVATTVTPQLIAQYNFNNTLNDVLGNTPFNALSTVTFGADRNGNQNEALYLLDGSRTASIANLPTGNAERTVSFWLKPITIQTSDNVVFMYGNPSANNAYGFSFKPTTINNFGWANDLTGSATIPVNTWKHIVCAYSTSGQATVYVDGVSTLTGSKPTWNTSSTGFVLSGIHGYIDDLKIYNYALSQQEITNLFNNNTLTSQNFNQNNLEVSLYPNPAKDVLNIEMTNEVKSVEIYNFQGQKVLESNQKQINVSNLSSGMYMIKVQDNENSVATKKVILK